MGFFKGFAGGLSQGMAGPNDPFSQILSERKRNEDMLLQQTMATGDWRVIRDKYLEMGYKEHEIMPLIIHLQKQEIMKLPDPYKKAREQAQGAFDEEGFEGFVDYTGDIPVEDIGQGDYYAEAFAEAFPWVEDRLNKEAEAEVEKVEQERIAKLNRQRQAEDRILNNRLTEAKIADLAEEDGVPPGTLTPFNDGTGLGYNNKTGQKVKLTDPKPRLAIGEAVLEDLREGRLNPFQVLPTVLADLENAKVLNPTVEAQVTDLIMDTVLKIEWENEDKKENKAQLQMLNSINKALNILEDEKFLEDYTGKFDQNALAIERWFESWWKDKDGSDDYAASIPQEIDDLIANLGLTGDQLARLRTGAAITADERLFFESIMGSIKDNPDNLRSKLQSFYEYTRQQRRTLYEAALSSRYDFDDVLVGELMESVDKRMRPMYKSDDDRAIEAEVNRLMDGWENNDPDVMREAVEKEVIGSDKIEEAFADREIDVEMYDELMKLWGQTKAGIEAQQQQQAAPPPQTALPPQASLTTPPPASRFAAVNDARSVMDFMGGLGQKAKGGRPPGAVFGMAKGYAPTNPQANIAKNVMPGGR